MAKAYWISCYRKVHDPAKLAAYGALAGPAITGGGGRFLARGGLVQAYEAGMKDRTVLIEFPSMDAAIATYGSPAYKTALDALGDGAERDVRITEGLE